MEEKRDETESLRYETPKVSWATAEFVRMPPPLTARLALYLIIFSVVVLVIFSFFFKILETVDGDGLLHYARPALLIASPGSGIVSKILILEKKHVNEGDALFEYREKPNFVPKLITAPKSGWVDHIFIGEPGEVVARQALASIIDDTVRLTARIKVPWFESPRIHPDMVVRVWPTGISTGGLRLDSTLGRVTSLPYSEVGVEKSQGTTLVSLEIESHVLERTFLLFSEGMAVRVSIVIGRRPLLFLLLNRFFDRSSQKVE